MYFIVISFCWWGFFIAVLVNQGVYRRWGGANRWCFKTHESWVPIIQISTSSECRSVRVHVPLLLRGCKSSVFVLRVSTNIHERVLSINIFYSLGTWYLAGHCCKCEQQATICIDFTKTKSIRHVLLKNGLIFWGRWFPAIQQSPPF